MTHLKLTAAAMCLLMSTAHASNEFTADLERIAGETISAWTAMPEVIDAVRAQNVETAGLSEDDILALDQQWRSETATGGDLIDTTLANALSQHLSSLKMAGQGQFTEIFVTDARGLNVGQSDVTSDYWQGDEAKWQVPNDTKAAHLGEVEFDESTQSYQSQVSVPVMDGGVVIGVITVGVDLEQLAAAY